jgi:hypothetical protein
MGQVFSNILFMWDSMKEVFRKKKFGDKDGPRHSIVKEKSSGA